jgi:RNA-binding protein Nova
MSDDTGSADVAEADESKLESNQTTGDTEESPAKTESPEEKNESPEENPDEPESKKRPAPNDEEAGSQAKKAHTDTPEDDLSLRMLVSSSKCGALIGKGGSGISKMQEDTGARLQLSKIDECFPGTSDRVLEAKGNLQALLMLQSIVLAKLQMIDGGTDDLSCMDTKLVVSDQGAGIIIGKAGSQIQQIQTSSEAEIHISKKGEHGFTGERLVSIKGSLENMLKASAEIMNLLRLAGECDGQNFRNSSRTGGGRGGKGGGGGNGMYGANGGQMAMGGLGGGFGMGGRVHLPPGMGGSPMGRHMGGNMGGNMGGQTSTTQSADGSVTTLVKISDMAAGNVIGRGGSTITQLQATSGANIQISKKGEAMDGTRTVTITGAPQAVEYAQMMVMSKVQAAIPADQAGITMTAQGMTIPQGQYGGPGHAGGAGMGGVGAGGSGGAAGQTQMQMEVNDFAAGHIIGKGGSAINEMQQMSGAKIQLSKKGELSNGGRTVTIKGAPQSVEYARYLVATKCQVAQQQQLMMMQSGKGGGGHSMEGHGN